MHFLHLLQLTSPPHLLLLIWVPAVVLQREIYASAVTNNMLSDSDFLTLALWPMDYLGLALNVVSYARFVLITHMI